MARLRADGVTLLPLYTGDGDRTVNINSDTYPGTGGVLGLTRAQLEEAKKNNVKPAGGAGFAYIRGPDDALIEVQGDMPAERFNHVHMYHEEPFCSQLWYQKHLNVAGAAGTPRRARRRAAHRGELQGAARAGQDLSGARRRRHVPRAADPARLQRRLDGRLHAPERRVARQHARPSRRSRRAQRRRISTRGSRSCAPRT